MWLKDSSGNEFAYRRPIAIDNSGGSSGAFGWSILLPKFDDLFWSNVRSSGEDMRVTAADGQTLITFEAAGFSQSTRTVTIEVASDTAEAGSAVLQRWLYWGNSAVSTASTSVVAGAKTGYLDLGRPTERQIKVRPERAGSTRWQGRTAKSASEQVWVYFDLRDMLQTFTDNYGRKFHYEEIAYVSYEVLAGGAAQAAMIDATSIRFIDGWCRVLVKAGTTGVNYTISLTVVTSLGRTLNPRAGLLVQSVSED
jgi:hypothetical protein